MCALIMCAIAKQTNLMNSVSNQIPDEMESFHFGVEPDFKMLELVVESEQIPGILGMRQEYALDQMPGYCKESHIHT